MKKAIRIIVLAFSAVMLFGYTASLVDEVLKHGELPATTFTSQLESFFELIPLIFFIGLTMVVTVYLLAAKKLKYEKQLYLCSAILFIPSIVLAVGFFFDLCMRYSHDGVYFGPPSMYDVGRRLLSIVIPVAIVAFLIFQAFNMKRMLKISAICALIIFKIIYESTIETYFVVGNESPANQFWATASFLVFYLMCTAGAMFVLAAEKQVPESEIQQPAS